MLSKPSRHVCVTQLFLKDNTLSPHGQVCDLLLLSLKQRLALCLVSSLSAMWPTLNHNNFPETLGSKSCCDAPRYLLFPGTGLGRVILYKPSTGTGYLQSQRTQIKEL